MAASEPSVGEKNLLNGSGPTIEDEQKDSSVTIMPNSSDNMSSTAAKDNTPDVPHTKLQEIPPNPQKPTQEQSPQTEKHPPNAHLPSQSPANIPSPPIPQTHQDKPNPLTTLTNSAEPPTTFHGWLAHSPTSPLTWGPFTPKKWEETDVDIAITHCGVCFSDLCTLREGWGPTQYPVCVG